MATLNDVLDKLKPAENIEVDFENYKDPSEFPPPIPAGVYTLRQGEPSFDVTKDGFLQATMTHEVVAPDNKDVDGHKVAFDRVSNKSFERQGVKVNMMVDQMRALGNTSRPSSHQDYGDALNAGTGQTFQAQLDWEAGCNHGADGWDGDVFRVRGMKRFPVDANGNHVPEITCPTCKAVLQARERISRRIPA